MAMKSFAFYRLPYSDSFTVIESEKEPLILSSVEEIGEVPGFVVVPFATDGKHPIVLIHPDNVKTFAIQTMHQEEDENKTLHSFIREDATQRDGEEMAYNSAFSTFNQAVNDGHFEKLVLARKSIVHLNNTPNLDMINLFHRACKLYPRLMIMLFSTPQTGVWLIASPEILVDGTGHNLHTVALAGTMPYQEGYPEWSEKNKCEQHIVEQYIEQTISPLCNQITKDGPVTMRAGNLLHLRTDFRFILDCGCTLGKLIQKLHPTPAVCGMPKEEARIFIRENEGLDRSYYSGFAGPVGINSETHLFVSLRCASLSPEVALYAGGGIMPESTAEGEWNETERKMETIRNVFR